MPDEKVIIIDYQHTKQNINTWHSNQEIDNITLWYQFLKQKVISRIFSHDN
jgi:phosphoribosylformimino-5-aminoimidazole carboxamide ribonucleotide (ProFAR) isomerase